MKGPGLLLTVLLLAASASAQSLSISPDAPGIAVMKNQWHKKTERNPLLDEDPLRPGLEAVNLRQERIEVMKDNAVRAKLGRDIKPIPTESSTSAAGRKVVTAGRPSVTYIYEVKIANNGTKAIKGLMLDYVFLDKETGAEIKRHRFKTMVSIKPGKSQTLFGDASSPPTGLIDVKNAGKDSRSLYLERVLIERIDYDDGSFWERTSN